MNKTPDEIPNFEELSILLKESDQDPENLGIIYRMMELDGYEEWYKWMLDNKPNELP